jgi:hypothetical protein
MRDGRNRRRRGIHVDDAGMTEKERLMTDKMQIRSRDRKQRSRMWIGERSCNAWTRPIQKCGGHRCGRKSALDQIVSRSPSSEFAAERTRKRKRNEKDQMTTPLLICTPAAARLRPRPSMCRPPSRPAARNRTDKPPLRMTGRPFIATIICGQRDAPPRADPRIISWRPRKT